MSATFWTKPYESRRAFIGGSDARIIMGSDEAALLRLWQEKRGEIEPQDLSGNLIIQLGLVTEALNRNWYERNTGQTVECVQHRLRHPVLRWMGRPLTASSRAAGRFSRPNSCCPGHSRKRRRPRSIWPRSSTTCGSPDATGAVLSIITGGGKWVEIKVTADSLYQYLLLTAEKKFWRCLESGEPPRLFGVEPPRARIEAVRIVDMSSSNAWAEFSGVFRRTREAYLEHENAKTELKGLMPEDAKEAIGHGIRAKRSKSGAVSFDVLSMEGTAHASLQ
jgi:hypothetical protein